MAMPGQKNHFHKVMGIFCTLFFVYFAAHYSYVTYMENSLSDVDKTMKAISNAFAAQPHNAFMFKSQFWDSGAILILFIGFLVDMLLVADWLRNKDQHRGKEKGTAKWNDGIKFAREYSYGVKAKSWEEAKKKVKKLPKFLQGLLQPLLYPFMYLKNIFTGNAKEEPPEDDAEPGNMIFSDSVRFNMNKMSNLNNNVVVVGGPGTGKTRGIIKPNMLQFNTSFVVTDPKGELMHDIGGALIKHGYHVKCFNLNEMEYSGGYNPFRYIRSDEQVMVLIDCLIKNTDDSKASKGDQFFAQAEKALFLAIFYYLYYFGSEEEKNMRQVMRLLSEAEVNEQDRNFKSALDQRFEEVKTGVGRINKNIKQADPDHVCLRSYNIFKQGTGKTAKSILISAQVRLAPFNIRAIENLTMRDTIHLEEIGESKQALFIVTPSGETTFNFLAAMMYTQLFATLYKQCNIDNINSHQLVKGNVCALRSELFKSKSTEESTLAAAKEKQDAWLKAELITTEKGNEDTKYTVWQLKSNEDIRYTKSGEFITKKGEILREFQSEREAKLFTDTLKNGKWTYGKRCTTVPVHFLLDEFKNIGEIPDFDQYLSTMRSYHISCTIILQSIDQIKAMYEDDWGTLMGDCSTQIFLGSSNQEDLEYFSKALGSATQTVRNVSESKGGKGGGANMSYNQDEYSLMKPEQLRVMPTSDCLVIISGQNPFYDKKFRLERHRNYHELEGNPFDHHLYFQLEDYVEPREQKTEKAPAFLHQASAINNVMETARGREFMSQREAALGVPPMKVPTSQKEVLEELAEKKGDIDLANKINQGSVHITSLQPLLKKPIPRPALKPNVTAEEVMDVVMYGDTGFPV